MRVPENIKAGPVTRRPGALVFSPFPDRSQPHHVVLVAPRVMRARELVGALAFGVFSRVPRA